VTEYNNIEKVLEKYKKQFSNHGRSGASLFFPKDRNKQRFSAIEKYITCSINKWSLLDYGCGFGDLNKYLKNCRKDDFTYHGVDIVEEFIDSNNCAEPEVDYNLIGSYEDIQEQYDYIAVVGVFNMMYSDCVKIHKEIIKNTVEHLFSKCTKWLSINFMADNVDYVQDGAYHQNAIEFYNYAYGNLSRRIILDQSYLPYEFSVIIYKDGDKSGSDSGMYLD